MDCTSTRIYLQAPAPDRAGFPEEDREAFDDHLASCPECARWARAEESSDLDIGRALRDVPVPAQMQRRLLALLAARRAPRPWTWISAAACLAVAIGLGAWWYLRPLPDVALLAVSQEIDFKTSTPPDKVEEWFRENGVAVAAPQAFNYDNLESFHIVDFHGRRVALLTFSFRGDSNHRPALAQVYVLPSRYFKSEDQGARVPTSTHTLQVHVEENPDFFYLVAVTGSSLDPFLKRAI